MNSSPQPSLSGNRLMVVTTGRADFGLLHPLLRKLAGHPRFDLQLVVTGSHLSAPHGMTIDVIKADPDLSIVGTVPMTPEEDQEGDICRAVARGLEGFSALMENLRPDAVLVLGDRYELWSVGLAAQLHRVPIIHLHGGEVTEGAIDEAVRHSLSKMAALHFPALPAYGQRLLRMGESPDRVHVVGALGMDAIREIPLLDPKALSASTGVDFGEPVALMTFHPVTLDDYAAGAGQVRAILSSLAKRGMRTLVTMPNADASGLRIYQMIQEWCEAHPGQFTLIKNLGQPRYLSAMKYAALMIGNSSSGIIEAVAFQLPVINIGDRQAGRFRTPNIIDCGYQPEEIENALSKALSSAFRAEVAQLKSPYGEGNTAEKIIDVLASIDFRDKDRWLKKKFFEGEPKSLLGNKAEGA